MIHYIEIHKYDFMGLLGFLLTTFFAWVSGIEGISLIQEIGKIIGIVGGIVLMIISIRHKKLQLHNEEVLNQLNEIKLRNEKILKEMKEVKETINTNSDNSKA
jgi:hypothetical protein